MKFRTGTGNTLGWIRGPLLELQRATCLHRNMLSLNLHQVASRDSDQCMNKLCDWAMANLSSMHDSAWIKLFKMSAIIPAMIIACLFGERNELECWLQDALSILGCFYTITTLCSYFGISIPPFSKVIHSKKTLPYYVYCMSIRHSLEDMAREMMEA